MYNGMHKTFLICMICRQASFIKLSQSNKGTFRASGMEGIEPMPSESSDWTPLSSRPNYAKGAVHDMHNMQINTIGKICKLIRKMKGLKSRIICRICNFA